MILGSGTVWETENVVMCTINLCRLASFLRIFTSSSQRHLKRVMNICFYFALRVSTLIFSVFIVGKEYYPIRALIELNIISKIYNPRLNIFLMLITRTNTAWLCVGVCNTYIYICLRQQYEGKWSVEMYCILTCSLIFNSGQRGKNQCDEV